jgi:serine/threonine protein kinase
MVMDFGIAKVTTSTRLTGTGQTMGTARYMSPEQIRGYEVDLRTDLYSLGVSLYESLCGETPFDGDSHFDIMTAHLTTPPPPLGERGAGVPPALERLVMTALGKDPEERPPSAAHMRGVLEELLAPHGPAPRRPSIELSTAPTATGTPVVRSRQRPILWLALATCALLAGAAAVVLIKANGASATRSRPESGSGSHRTRDRHPGPIPTSWLSTSSPLTSASIHPACGSCPWRRAIQTWSGPRSRPLGVTSPRSSRRAASPTSTRLRSTW